MLNFNILKNIFSSGYYELLTGYKQVINADFELSKRYM